jgi:transcriptional regulator with XRE-family HTH domain
MYLIGFRRLIPVTEETMQEHLRAGTGLKVKRLREGAGLSQTRLAELMTEKGAPFNQPGIVRVEQAQRVLSLDEALIMCQVLEVDLDVLIDDPEDLEYTNIQRQLDSAKAEIAARQKKIAGMKAKIAEYQAAIPDIEDEISYYRKVWSHHKQRMSRLADR